MSAIRFTKNDRQAIIDDYLNKTGRNSYVPSEFIQWLRDKPDHKVYDTFFGTSDAEMADKHRENLARNLASGLRITIKVSELPMPQNTDSIKVETVTVPSMVSPINSRANGGGYIAVDVQDTNTMHELCKRIDAEFDDVDLSIHDCPTKGTVAVVYFYEDKIEE